MYKLLKLITPINFYSCNALQLLMHVTFYLCNGKFKSTHAAPITFLLFSVDLENAENWMIIGN